MEERIAAVIDRLAARRSLTLLRLIDDAKLDGPSESEPDAAEVIQPYRWLVRRVGDGLKLTGAGYLPPAVVVEAMTELGWMEGLYGKGNREDHTPMLELRESAQRFGLLRKHLGRLLPTKLGRALVDDPEKMWWHIASRLPDARTDAERDAGVIHLLTVAAARPTDQDLLAEGMAVLGWAAALTREPMAPIDAFRTARDTWAVFRRLGLISKTGGWFNTELSPSPAGVRLARAALLGPITSTATPEAADPPRATAIVELTVTLEGADPAIWRRLRVAATTTLNHLHEIIQVAMGWHNYHLHMFEIGTVLYGDLEDVHGRTLGDENSVTLGDVAKAAPEFKYEYDFGDSWGHHIRIVQVVSSIGVMKAELLDGARACPPEDCGGVWGYEHLLEVLANPAAEEFEELRLWVGGEFDPEAFDLATTNANLELIHRHLRRARR